MSLLTRHVVEVVSTDPEMFDLSARSMDPMAVAVSHLFSRHASPLPRLERLHSCSNGLNVHLCHACSTGKSTGREVEFGFGPRSMVGRNSLSDKWSCSPALSTRR